MRCMACGTEMILVNVAQGNTMAVPGFEHRTFRCSECQDVEERLAFMKAAQEDNTVAPPIVPASTAVQDEDLAASSLLSRVVAKIRGQ
jgi:hypothetical protein